MIIALSLIMLGLAFCQIDKNRKILVLIYSFEKIISEIYFHYFSSFHDSPSGFYYYGVMAIFEFFAFYLISKNSSNSNLKNDLMIACLISIVLNFAGYVCWYFYIPHAAIYNSAFLFLYLFVVLIILNHGFWGNRDDGNNRLSDRVLRFRITDN